MNHVDGDPLTDIDFARGQRVCALHCSVCEGGDHHWLDQCADEGDPIQVCKHCPAWRPCPDDDDETPEVPDGWLPDGSWAP